MLPIRQHKLIVGDCDKALDRIPDQSCALLITSPPYNIGKEYERGEPKTLAQYKRWLAPIIKKSCEKVSSDGHICWQTGNHTKSGAIYPLDYFVFETVSKLGYKLRNRIVWHFNFGLNAERRFSGRYETLLWFTKSDNYHFDLDAVRVPQLYPGKRHPTSRKKGAGLPSGNPKGKNPSDFWTFSPADAFREHPIWEFPNVKARHPEKTGHPCQFPIELVERCVLAMTTEGDAVLDPFVGSGTSVLAAAKHGRRGIGIDRSRSYIKVAKTRLISLYSGQLDTRPLGKPVRQPVAGERVATLPEEWKSPRNKPTGYANPPR